MLQDGRYEIDFDLLERQAADGAKMLLFCAPQSGRPRMGAGKSWRALVKSASARRVGRCGRNHQDLVSPGHQAYPVRLLQWRVAEQTFTCIATSKTFNLAGLRRRPVVIPNADLRRRYNHVLKTFSLHMESYFCFTAMVADTRTGMSG